VRASRADPLAPALINQDDAGGPQRVDDCIKSFGPDPYSIGADTLNVSTGVYANAAGKRLLVHSDERAGGPDLIAIYRQIYLPRNFNWIKYTPNCWPQIKT
jgi:hypothetical protein